MNKKKMRALQISVVKNGSLITIKVEKSADKPYTIRLVNLQAVNAAGSAIKLDGKDTLLTPQTDTVTVTL